MLTFSIALTFAVNKLKFFNDNKKITICGIWTYYILSQFPIVDGIFGFIPNAITYIASIARYIGIVLIMVGAIKSFVKTTERRKEKRAKEKSNNDITNILD